MGGTHGGPCCKSIDDKANFQDTGQWNCSDQDTGIQQVAFDAEATSGTKSVSVIEPEAENRFAIKHTFGRGPSVKHRTVGRRSYDDLESALNASDKSQNKDEEVETLICHVLQHNDPLQKFVKLGNQQLKDLAGIAWSQEFDEGDHLFYEGDLDNDMFYIIAEGSFNVDSSEALKTVENGGVTYLSRPEVPRKEKTTLTIGRSSCIGELSMLLDVPRVGTVIATAKSMVWCIDKSSFTRVQQSALRNQRRSVGHAAIGAPLGSEDETNDSPAKPKDVEWLLNILRVNSNIQHVVNFSNHHLQKLVDAAWLETFLKDQVIATEGELNAESFFIVESGSVELSSSQPFEIMQQDGMSWIQPAQREFDGITVRVVERGMCFGVIAVLYGAPRIFTSKALESTEMWCISRSAFRQVQRQAAEEHTSVKVALLEKIDVLSSMSPDDKIEIANLLDDIRFVEHDTIAEAGGASNTLCVLLEGSVRIVRDGKAEKTLTADRSTGVIQYFLGEKMLAKNQTVQVSSAFASGYVLPLEYFYMLTDSLAKPAEGNSFGKTLSERPVVRQTSQEIETPKTVITSSVVWGKDLSLKSFQTVGILGTTILGPVEHSKFIATKKSYALRRYSKLTIDQKEMKLCIMREREIWRLAHKIRSKFVVECYAFFNDPNSLCILVEAALGGPLSIVYPNFKLFGNQDHARYYIACAAIALTDLQKHRILLRNLKPENMLLTEGGRLKLGNMGLAKVLRGKSYTTCGTPDYMAPEVLIGSGYSKGIDWYALGVVTFELITSHTPFEASHPMEVYSGIMRGIAKVEFPDNCRGAVEKFIRASLKADPVDRLAMRQGGINNIIEHKWYANFDFKAIKRTDYKPPFVPGLENLHLLGEVKTPKVAVYKNKNSDWDQWEHTNTQYNS